MCRPTIFQCCLVLQWSVLWRGCQDFLDTAEVIRGLDLIIAVDTAVAHLAASMGKQVWLILPEAADWRWGMWGDTTPWYPTMKLFRHATTREELVARLGDELKRSAEKYILRSDT